DQSVAPIDADYPRTIRVHQRCAPLVLLQMGTGAAEDCRNGGRDEAERQGIGSRACRHHRNREIPLKNLAKARFRTPGMRVLPIRQDVAVIARNQCVEDTGMNSADVVAAEVHARPLFIPGSTTVRWWFCPP